MDCRENTLARDISWWIDEHLAEGSRNGSQKDEIGSFASNARCPNGVDLVIGFTGPTSQSKGIPLPFSYCHSFYTD
jgi:hypothetical protein